MARASRSTTPAPALDQAALRKELDGVADQLADRSITGPKRLVVLRRQAQLGDLRDALAQRARRAQ
jgi:hypothetical protein